MKLWLALLFLYVIAVPAQAITVQDFSGREVTLDQPAKRIVALAPHIVENLYSAGAGDKLVGVVSYSDFPDEAKNVPEVGTYNAFSLEQVLALNPDLVVMWGSGNGMQTLSTFEALGIPVYVSELRQLSDVPKSIRNLSQLAGTPAIGEAEASRIETELNALHRRYGEKRSLSVLYQIWNDPLQTVNGEHLISEIIALCGGHNVFGDASSLAPRVSIESVLLRDPDAIVASGMGEARPEWLDQWRAYPSLTAVADEALFFVNPDHLQRPSARIVLGARSLCQQLDQIR
ncbi:cobalamin-binding protein [Halioglobus sp. Uisw_031]|jgi:iron complex transport system substrate-binding protein|uniref:cobalamin-binding protein n=1 Tax=Halioglobus sp. Uisw_031 TaxID=3230977 RepID=UPI0039EB9EDE